MRSRAAVVMMGTRAGAADLAQAEAHLGRAEHVITADPPGTLKTSHPLLRAIHAGVSGQRQAATQHVSRTLRIDSKNLDVADRVAALGL